MGRPNPMQNVTQFGNELLIIYSLPKTVLASEVIRISKLWFLSSGIFCSVGGIVVGGEVAEVCTRQREGMRPMKYQKANYSPDFW